MSLFEAPSPALVAALVRAQPLALVVSGGGESHHVTPLPLVPQIGLDGVITGFIGHFARRNPQVAAIEADPRALILFQGANGYIPPRAVSRASWAPTWNYAVAQFETAITLVPEGAATSIDILMEAVETSDWRPATHIPERQAAMMAHVVAFHARVIAQKAKFKLGQDENPTDFSQIVDWLGADPLADWMRRAREA